MIKSDGTHMIKLATFSILMEVVVTVPLGLDSSTRFIILLECGSMVSQVSLREPLISFMSSSNNSQRVIIVQAIELK